jgi:glycosyltransferase involved in cell wall biosynthesis
MLIVNATQIKKGYSGVGVYSINITKQLFKNFKSGIVYTCLDVFGDLQNNWQVKTINNLGRDLIRWMWLSFIFPFKLKKNDVLFSTFTEAPFLFRGKLIIVVHDLMPLRFPEKHSKKLRFYYSKILLKNLKTAYKIIAISETTKNEIVEFFPGVNRENIDVIYNGYDSGIFNNKPEKKNIYNFKIKHGLDKYILYVGRISRIKNIMCLIEAFNKIYTGIIHDLLIIGKDESDIMPEVRDFINRKGIENRVLFIEYLCENEIQLAYKGAELFVNPSLSEGFGFPAIEAMACGTPCILSDIEAFRELFGTSAFLFDPNNNEQLAEKILLLLSNEKLHNTYRALGLKRVKYFSWENTGTKISEILKDALETQ